MAISKTDLIVATIFTAPLIAVAEMPLPTCEGQYRNLIESKLIEEATPLRMTLQSGDAASLAGSLRGRNFYAVVTPGGKDLLLQILPTDTDQKGLVARTALNLDGRAALSEVSGNEVYKIECRRAE